jgi:tetratricopeptide (TPR) repeat protein
VALENSKDLFARSEGARYRAAIDEMRGKLSLVPGDVARSNAADSARGASVVRVDDAAVLATQDAWYRGKPDATVRKLDALMPAFQALPKRERPYFSISVGYSRAGRPDKARAMLARFDADNDTTWKRIRRDDRDFAFAEVSVAEKRYAEAIALYRKADSLPDGPSGGCECMSAPIGLAFDLAGKPDSAIAYLERYLADPSPAEFFSATDAQYRSGVMKRLGELYEARGDRQKAIAYYQKFVALWKDADPELQPRVAEVRKRIARLAAVERP